MCEVTELFNKIGRDDISGDEKNLLSSGRIDSMDVMALVSAVESLCKKPVNADFVDAESFESFESIANLIEKVRQQ